MSRPTATATPPRLLVAIDLDGTLLRDDKTVAPADADAIRRAAACGVAVTLATGRLTTGTLPVARQLDLTTPIICADGGLLVDVATGDTLDRRSIPADRAGAALEVLEAHGLAPFIFLADSIHCDDTGARHRSYVDIWSRNVVVHPSLRAADSWRQTEGVSLTVGLGDNQDAVVRATERLDSLHGDALDSTHFNVGGLGLWAVRSLPRGCDKGEMLGKLAARLGVPAASVAAIGDWYNDLGMFAFAGRSFAMAQAPDLVRAAATDQLRASSATGGGVAEALASLLATLAA